MRLNLSERGVALSMAILVIGVFAILLAAGFSALGSERRVNANDEAAVDAFALAQTGLERFIGRRDSLGFTAMPPAVRESTRLVLRGGYADVVLAQVRTDSVAGLWAYVVRSHGVITVRALRGTPQAERTVAEYAVWEPGQMKLRASWTSLTGLNKNGASSMGTGGVDACGKQPTIGGVAVPASPGYTQNGTGLAPQGNPPVVTLGATPAAAAGAVNIDWNGPDFEKQAAGLDKSKTYLVHCAGGVRSAKACAILDKSAFSHVVNLEPGFKAWENAGKPVEKK